ncbi:hypothetical protein [Cellulomonas composti]|uniref:ESX-1 secretion-associated protein n=1 Tax=Cellulomonas composti TaxID=266130 RepID=A0A511J7G7_9CELL|nr:hypothetical protein [Cellulomonas composti]GEL93952.1 hypothetical protein CCO02nite_06100 [Cellulomonas composti]
MDLTIALEALTEDAGRWHELSEVLDAASKTAATLTATDVQLSWAAVDSGLLDVYSRAVSTISSRLGEGRVETDLIGTTLIEVRDAYAASDERARATYAGMWTPRE